MRITSNTFTSLVINSSQSAQQQLAQLQQQISSGETVEFASDNPLIYNQASQAQVSLAQLNSYNSSINTATSLTSANNTAMSSIHQIVANASELATSVTTDMSASSLAAVGTQVDSLISQLTSTVNQQYDGNYLFGGTANQPPITSGAYNANTNGQTTSINVQAGNSVQTGIVAGRPGSPGVDGFLYDSSSGTDVLASLQQLSADLFTSKAGNASARCNRPTCSAVNRGAGSRLALRRQHGREHGGCLVGQRAEPAVDYFAEQPVERAHADEPAQHERPVAADPACSTKRACPPAPACSSSRSSTTCPALKSDKS